MRLRHLGLIGAGSIVREMMVVLARALPAPLEQVTVLVRPGRVDDVRATLAPFEGRVMQHLTLCETVSRLCDTAPDLVIEAAGHGAVRDGVPLLLAQGIETVVASTGALSDADLHAALHKAATQGQTRLILPAGAVGAMDILAGLHHSDVQDVTYISRKPPAAWRGTPAETLLDLDALDTATVFFDGTARDAARQYPKNANVAASIALAGLGFERTRVQMIADPDVTSNIHAFDITGDAADVHVRIEGKPAPGNPKTSLPTVYSLVREVMRRVSPIVS